MKLLFDVKGFDHHMISNVIAVPTTAKEKNFFSICKDAKVSYKPWVYKKLYELGNSVIDNPMADVYDEDGSLIYDSDPLMDMVHEAEQEGDYVGIPKPSNFCLISLYCTLTKKFRKARRVKLLYEKKTDMYLNQSVTIKEEGDLIFDL